MTDTKTAAEAPREAIRYLNERQLANLLNLSPRTLQGWRVQGNGMPYVKIGHSVRYDLEHVRKWLAERECSHTTEAAAKGLCSMREAYTDAPDRRGNVDTELPTTSSDFGETP